MVIVGFIVFGLKILGYWDLVKLMVVWVNHWVTNSLTIGKLKILILFLFK